MPSSTNKATALLLFLAFVLLAAPAQAATYNWDGSQNNNWDNGPNWFGASGWPDSATDDAVFDTDNYGLNDRDIDLRGGTFDVGLLNMDGAHDPLTFFSSTAQQGTLRLNGNMDYTQSAFTGNGIGHTFNIDLEVVGNSTWIGGEGHRVAISGELRGTGDITTLVDLVNLRGFELIRLSSANSYSGTLTINHGYVTIADTNSLQNARVTLNWDNGLRMNNDINANIGVLAGSGNLNLGGGIFTTTSSVNTTFNGNITGSATGQFKKNGTGTLTLTGSVSTIQRLQNGNDGELILDGNSVTVDELVGDLGELTLQNGADVNMSGTGTAWSGLTGTLKVTGAGTQLRNGAELAAATGTGEGTINILDSAQVSNFDIVTAGRLGTGDIIVQGNATLSAAALGLGGKDDLTNGGTGELSVLTGGHVAIESETRLWTDTSTLIVFSGGTMATGTLTNPVGTSPTVLLVEPSAGLPALTIGTDDAVPISTFSGIIEDLSLTTPGTLAKTGSNHAVLSGNNSFTGGISLNGGTLGLAHNNAAGTGAITVLGSTIDFADGVNIGNPIDLQSHVTLNVDTGSTTQSGLIGETGGSFGITKTGAGSLMFSAANTYSGNTSIDAGSIVIGNTNALQNGTVSINTNDGLDVNGLDTNIGALAGNGALDLAATKMTTGANGATTSYFGALTGIAGSHLRHQGAGTLTLTGPITGVSQVQASDGHLILSGNTALLNTGSALVSAAGGDLTIADGATVDQNGIGIANTGSGATLTVIGAGTVLTNANRLDITTGTGSGHLVVTDFASLTNFNNINVARLGTASLTVSGSANLNIGSLDLGGIDDITNSGTGTAIIESDATAAVTGQTKLWSDTSSLTIDNATFSTGTLDSLVATSPTISISDPNSSPALTVGTGSGTSGSNSSTFEGLIQDAAGGSGSLLKTGTGTLALTGTNTYSGGTTIDGGTLLANNTSGSATGTGGVTVNAGGTFGGTGSSTGTSTVVSGGTFAPGGSVGQLTVDGVLFNAGSTFAVELAGNGGVAGIDFDQLVVSNNATLGGDLDVSLISIFTPSLGQSFDVVDVGGSLSGTFSGLPQAALVGNYGGTDLFIDYASGDGNDVSLVATLAGDFDLDFDVDGFDFLMWQRGESPDPLSASDLSDWESNFGTIAPLSTVSDVVPEPTSLTLLSLSGLLALRRSRCKAAFTAYS